jgi:hypothetical protein
MKTMTILEPHLRCGKEVLYCFPEILSFPEVYEACAICLKELDALWISGHNVSLDTMRAPQVEHFEWFASRFDVSDDGVSVAVFDGAEVVYLTGAQAAEGLRRLKELDRLARAPASPPS